MCPSYILLWNVKREILIILFKWYTPNLDDDRNKYVNSLNTANYTSIMCASSLTIISTETEVDKKSSNFSLDCCVHFYTNTLGEGMNLTHPTPSYYINSRLISLALDNRQSWSWSITFNSKPWKSQWGNHSTIFFKNSNQIHI